MSYRIEPIGYEHLGACRLLYQRWMYESPCDYPGIDNEEFDNFVVAIAQALQRTNFNGFVAGIGHRIVGFIAGEIHERMIGKPHRYATVHWLYVVPKHRSKGVARLLMAAGAQWVVSQGVDTLEHFAMYGDNSWERRGFIPYQTKYYLPVARELEIGRQKANGLDRTEHP